MHTVLDMHKSSLIVAIIYKYFINHRTLYTVVDEVVLPCSVIVCVQEASVDGIVVCNTTVQRENLKSGKYKQEQGGLSGEPLRDVSTGVISQMYALTEGALSVDKALKSIFRLFYVVVINGYVVNGWKLQNCSQFSNLFRSKSIFVVIIALASDLQL